MADKAKRYERIIKDAGTHRVVPVGRKWRQSCTTLPDSLDEARDLIRRGPNSRGDTFKRGPGDDYILNNAVELFYYHDSKLVKHLK